MREKKILELLKDYKLSITTPRKLILDLLLRKHGPFSADDILNLLPKNTCDLATIYRSLNQFVEVGLVTTSHFNKDLVHYEYNDQHHHHHHIICRICKKIESIEECILGKFEKVLGKKGYIEIGHKLEFFGICQNCQK
jgi:Fur family ferric uptake transcriptional regulator